MADEIDLIKEQIEFLKDRLLSLSGRLDINDDEMEDLTNRICLLEQELRNGSSK